MAAVALHLLTRIVSAFELLVVSAIVSTAIAQTLPPRAAVPEAAPERPAGEPPSTAPLPEQRPDEKPPAAAPEETPADPALPDPRPERPDADPGGAENGTGPDAADKPAKLPERVESPGKVAPPKPAIVPPEEMACRARLTEAGAEFTVIEPALSDPKGCTVPFPLELKSAGNGVDIAPDAVLNCTMAEELVRFAAATIDPAAQLHFGARLKAISNDSAYVCRARASETKLSEHAFGNAFDIGRFILEGGRTVEVKATSDPKEAMFLAAVRMAACGPFKTVLGPGSNADHALHFHFDLARRRNGSTYCR